MRAKGANKNGARWKVGLEMPAAGTIGEIYRAIAIENQAVATSGTYRQFWSAGNDSTSYSHILDPRTGKPVAHRVVAVSVVAPTAMQADAWATALLVLGRDEGLPLAEKHQLAANFITDTGSQFEEEGTAAFKALVDGE